MRQTLPLFPSQRILERVLKHRATVGSLSVLTGTRQSPDPRGPCDSDCKSRAEGAQPAGKAPAVGHAQRAPPPPPAGRAPGLGMRRGHTACGRGSRAEHAHGVLLTPGAAGAAGALEQHLGERARGARASGGGRAPPGSAHPLSRPTCPEAGWFASCVPCRSHPPLPLSCPSSRAPRALPGSQAVLLGQITPTLLSPGSRCS